MRRLALGLLLTVAGCRPPTEEPIDSPAPFRFETTAADEVQIVVRDASGPLAGVLVTVHEARGVGDDGVSPRGGVLFQGLSNLDGLCRGRLVRERTLEQVRVSVLRAGYRGRHDDPALRAQLGPFAPAALFVVAPSELGALPVDLRPEAVSP